MKNISSYNDKNERHGYWVVYHLNGNIRYKGNWVNDTKNGYWEEYNSNGKLLLKEFYI